MPSAPSLPPYDNRGAPSPSEEPEKDNSCLATYQFLAACCTPWYLLLATAAIVPGMGIASWVLRVNAAGGSRYVVAYVVSGYCAMLAVALSLWNVWQHVLNYTSPPLQQKIIRIILMVPIYATHSWCALRFRSWAPYLNLIRDSYEAFVVYQFFSLLVAYLGGDERCVLLLLKQPPLRALFPVSLLEPRPLRPGPVFLRRVYICVLQYVLLKPFFSLLAMALTFMELYHEGAITDLTDAYPYITLVVTTSVAVAVLALAHFYLATAELLAGIRPLRMFLSVKAVLFASFWQSVAIALCTHVPAIWGPPGHWAADVAIELQDFLICVEMLLVALAFSSVFSYRPFICRDGPGRRKVRLPSWQDASNAQHSLDPRGMVGDAYHDVWRILGGHLNEDFLDRFLVEVDDGVSVFSELPSERSSPRFSSSPGTDRSFGRF